MRLAALLTKTRAGTTLESFKIPFSFGKKGDRQKVVSREQAAAASKARWFARAGFQPKRRKRK